MSICLAITDADWALTKDVFSVIGTVFAVIGVLLAGIYGFLGLATWRRQNKGTADHELSRRLLIDIYKLRDRIRQVRNPVMFINEDLTGDDPSQQLYRQQVIFKHTADFYQNQFSAIDEIRSRLETSLLESEAVWDEKLKLLVRPVLDLQSEIFTKVISYLGSINPNETEDRVLSHRNVLKHGRNSLYESHIEGEDTFNAELKAALSTIEDYLRPKLI